uniref:Macro domain-containing protein n=1 Tax=Strigamia maritima TaxID=126957 RepID=T1JFI6_STRMM
MIFSRFRRERAQLQAMGGYLEMADYERDFVFIYNDGYGEYKLTAPIRIPLRISVKEYSCRLFNAFSTPCYIEKQLEDELGTFVRTKTDEYYETEAETALAQLKPENIKNLAKNWTRAYQEEHVSYAKPEEMSDEAVFSRVYHKMVHTGALDVLTSLEHSYNMAMDDLIRERDADLEMLQRKQSQEMEKVVQSVGFTTSDDHVNSLSARHFEDSQLLHSKWASELNALFDTQKRNFVDCVMKLYEDFQTFGKLPTRSRASTNRMNGGNWNQLQPSRMEESFTIHLGAQMKLMHNLRLVATDALSFCWQKPTAEAGSMPQRLQTAMSLYSSNLCALVLLVDKRINSYTGIKRQFAQICQRNSEFHFSELEDQLERVRHECDNVREWRKKTTPSLDTGDFYVTRHSGLSEVHVIIHLVGDDSVHSTDISSRHPAILGLRNALKVACTSDITTITLPLFLVHEMTEEMTVSWCLKRAELIFKCIKGFMMEMASWGGHESRTVQFLVPDTISEELFGILATMLPSIFRMSNPLVVK